MMVAKSTNHKLCRSWLSQQRAARAHKTLVTEYWYIRSGAVRGNASDRQAG
jgi:hypothetical protein